MTGQDAFDVVAIGNALVDVLAHHDDDFLAAHGLTKGGMALLEPDDALPIYEQLKSPTRMSGGSAANTIAGIASFGGRAAFMGRVYDDDLGGAFAKDLDVIGVTHKLKPATDGPPTGRCLIVVSQDAERTMVTSLGASALFSETEIDADLISRAKVTYLEGYLFDRPESKVAYRAASKVAAAAGREVALTLSDLFCVERHREDWLPLINDHVDILFANEAEALALWQVDTVEDAVEKARQQVSIAAITVGEKGSLIVAGDETHEVTAAPVDQVVDTTGAGDLYAAGFLYGYTQGRPLPECGRLGSLSAAAVIQQTGARVTRKLTELLDG